MTTRAPHRRAKAGAEGPQPEPTASVAAPVPGHLVHGFHSVREALRSRPQHLRRVLMSDGDGGRRREIRALCERHQVSLEIVGDGALQHLAPEAHQGFVAEIEDLGASIGGGVDTELVVLLEDIQDPRNLGALLRVCEGAGVGRVLVRDRGSAPLTSTVAHTSAGASEWVALERITNTANELARFKKEGFWIYGAAEGGTPPWDLDLQGPLVLCLGGEESGLRHRTRETCDALVGLPMRGRVSSLNVATAASALLYEAVRQRV